MNDEGRCHYVGHYYGSLSKQKKVYCCYPTKLLRIFNEKAREQMFPGKSKEELWGSPKKPKCHGFSLQEMEGKVDFSKIDFSEAASDFPIDEAQIEREMVERLSEAVKKPQLNAFFLEEPDATH